MSSGLLRLPHLGDCTQEGQPSSHSHAAIAPAVASTQRRACAKPRSANPAPPGRPSYTNTAGEPVSGCRTMDTPPMSQRSLEATSGIMPIMACSAACRAPGSRSMVSPAATSSSEEAWNHTPEVNRSRAGRSRGSSPSTSPDSSALRWKEITWVRTCRSPRHQRSEDPAASSRRCTATISTSVTSRACVVKSGQARRTSTACPSSSSSSTRNVRSWWTYTAPGWAW